MMVTIVVMLVLMRVSGDGDHRAGDEGRDDGGSEARIYDDHYGGHHDGDGGNGSDRCDGDNGDAYV